MGPPNQVDTDKYTVNKSIRLRVLMCGDLAFFAAVLGKVNMSGKWCVWCQLGPSEWSMPSYVPGDGWTIKKMQTLREKIINGDVNTPSEKKGIVEKPLINTIPVDHIIFSLLHAQIWMDNKLLNSFWNELIIGWNIYHSQSLMNEMHMYWL